MNKKIQKALQILIIVLFVAFGIYRIIQARILNKKNLSYALELYASNMNNECPIAVGTSNNMIIKKIYFVESKTVVYEYKMMNYKKDSFDVQQLRENIVLPIIEELESIHGLSKLRNKDVIFEYHFFDSLDEELFRLAVLFNTPITYQ